MRGIDIAGREMGVSYGMESDGLDPSRRLAWLERASAANLEHVPKDVRDWLQDTVKAPFSNATEEFAFLIRCVQCAIEPSSATTRADWARSYWIGSDVADDDLDNRLFSPMAKWYLTSRLVRWPHWALHNAYEDTLLGTFAARIAAGDNQDDIISWAAERWLSSAVGGANAGMMQLARRLWNDTFATALERLALPTSMLDRISERAASLADQGLSDVPQYIQHAAAVISAGRQEGATDKLRMLAQEVQRWISCALELESLTVRRLVATELEPEDVADIWKVTFIEDDGLRAPTVLATSSPQAPAWIVGRIVNLGARLMHELTGPLPYWFIALETQTRWGGRIGLADLEQRGSELTISVVYGDEHDVDGPVHCPIGYNLDFAGDLLELCFLVVVGGVRLDFFHVDSVVQLLGCVYVRLPSPVVTRLRDIASQVIREVWGSDIKALWAAVVRGHEQDNMSGFMSGEWSKGEDVHEDIALSMAATEQHKLSTEWSSYGRARKEWLLSEAARARQQFSELVTHRSPTQSTSAAKGRAEFVRARERLRASCHELFESLGSTPRVAQLRRVLSRDEAFVHVQASGTHELHAFVLQGGTADISDFPMLGIPLLRVADLLRDADLRHSGSSLKKALRILSPDFKELFDALLQCGIRHVIVSMPGQLDSLPIQILPAGPANLPAFEVFESLAFCISGMMFAERVRRPDLKVASMARPVCVLAYEGLHGLASFHEEIVDVSNAWVESRVLRRWIGSAATPSRCLDQLAKAELLHIVAHGSVGDNPLTTAIELFDAVPSKGLLSVADILNCEIDSLAARVVVLSSCYGGAHQSSAETPHNLAAMDNTLLRLGARCVVSASRRIDGEDAARFAGAFHRALAGHSTTGEAYRCGLEAIIDSCSDAEVQHVWQRLSPFRLVGDARIRLHS